MSFRKYKWRRMVSAVMAALVLGSSAAQGAASIYGTHVYHNHMPNFWAYYEDGKYEKTPVGGPIRYMYDGDVMDILPYDAGDADPPAGYPYVLPEGYKVGHDKVKWRMMPHDDLVTYYSHPAKQGAYTVWPWTVAKELQAEVPEGQVHVTMSGAVINNVDNIFKTGNRPGIQNPNWGKDWTNTFNNLKTTNGYRTLDAIHFTGHHSMGPLTGDEYFLKDMIFHNVTLAQPYFLGDSFKSSNGFFPTELGFSNRLIPTLKKLGVEWSVLGNNHYSRTLIDYPYLNEPSKDMMTTPPNRADFQNKSDVGEWVDIKMAHQEHMVVNKFPFASTPHYVKYVDPITGEEMRIAGIPVDQNGSWLEGWEGQAYPEHLEKYVGLLKQPQYFVIAHDGDNSQGRAGSITTWRNAREFTYKDNVMGMGVDEYLKNNPIDPNDVVHVQDGSWIDTRDSASDPQWHHWKLPFGIWNGNNASVAGNGQWDDLRKVYPETASFKPKLNLDGQVDRMTVSFEYGYHYLERNFALLQPALNYAKTAEQIWLDDNPNYWQPTTALDKEITYPGNQLNPHMFSFPVKGDEKNNYKGGANPAELAWYFLLPAIDSGFGYYDENITDSVKPTLSFNNSLKFSVDYVEKNLAKDKTGPSVWWPQRWPYNPGSPNSDKSLGWTTHYFDNAFAVYTYAHDVSGIKDIKVKIREHKDINWQNRDKNWITALDNTFRVYDPKALQAKGVPNIDASKVTEWKEYPMLERDLSGDINGVDWQAENQSVMQKVPAQKIGNLYYSYFKEYRDQMLDYYIEAVDSKGNVTKSEIQTVYVGSGKYKKEGTKYIEDPNGDIQGTYPFVTDKPMEPDTEAPSIPGSVQGTATGSTVVSLKWTPSTDNNRIAGYEVYRNGEKIGTTESNSFTDTGLKAQTSYKYKVKAYDSSKNYSEFSQEIEVTTKEAGQENLVTIYYKKGFDTPYIHYRPIGGTWTAPPGVKMNDAEVTGYSKFVFDAGEATGAEVVFNNGSGQWDSNGGKNYSFPLGTSTFTAGVITAGGPGPEKPDTTKPTVATNLKTSTLEANKVSLQWSASTDDVGVVEYRIYRESQGVPSKVIGTSKTSIFTDGSVAENTKYTYVVTAVDKAGNESEGAALEVQTPKKPVDPIVAPTNLKASLVEENKVVLQWDSANSTEKNIEFNIYRSRKEDNLPDIYPPEGLIGTTKELTYTDLNVIKDTEYIYRVIAKDETGNLSSPALIEVKTPTTQSETLKLLLGAVQGKVGDVINVPLHLENINDKSIDGFDLWVKYDPQILEFVKVDSKVKLNHHVEGGQVRMLYSELEKIVDGKDLITLQFKIKSDVNSTTPIEVLKEYGKDYTLGFYNKAEEKYEVEYVNGKVDIEKGTFKLGDLNKDGVLDSQDVLMTIKITLGSIKPTEEEIKAADANEDKIVNVLDALRIIKMIIGK